MLRRPSDRGSALMLMPAAVLILLVLGALAVDSAIVWSAQRELANRAAAAANDIAATAVDDEAFYQRGEVKLDEAVARRVADAITVADGGLRSVIVDDVTVSGREVRVALRGTVRRLFGPAVGQRGRERTVYASATAVAR
ncbi:MAG: hypothetical protein ACR2H3_12715 [Acidimicrobiales bacterium]